jgi:hypothetical protein
VPAIDAPIGVFSKVNGNVGLTKTSITGYDDTREAYFLRTKVPPHAGAE